MTSRRDFLKLVAIVSVGTAVGLKTVKYTARFSDRAIDDYGDDCISGLSVYEGGKLIDRYAIAFSYADKDRMKDQAKDLLIQYASKRLHCSPRDIKITWEGI